MELLLSSGRPARPRRALAADGGKLWQVGLTRLTRFVILEEDGEGVLPGELRHGCQVVAYDRFMDAFCRPLERHVADIAVGCTRSWTPP